MSKFYAASYTVNQSLVTRQTMSQLSPVSSYRMFPHLGKALPDDLISSENPHCVPVSSYTSHCVPVSSYKSHCVSVSSHKPTVNQSPVTSHTVCQPPLKSHNLYQSPVTSHIVSWCPVSSYTIFNFTVWPNFKLKYSLYLDVLSQATLCPDTQWIDPLWPHI